MLYASERTRQSLSDSARRQRANHKLAYSWRLPATNAKGAKRISHGAANNRLTIGRDGSLATTSNSDPQIAVLLFPAVAVFCAQFGDQAFEPPGDRDTQGAEVFDDAEAFVGEVEEDHRRAQGGAAAAQQGLIEELAEADHQEDQDFFENPPEAPGAGRRRPECQ